MTAFATTRWSLVTRAALGDAEHRGEALEALCRSYWKPAYIFVRSTGQDEEAAKDVTQAFFARILEKGALSRADPGLGKFRTFLLTLLKRFLADWRDHGRALKRGGGMVHVPLDLAEAPQLVAAGESPEEAYDRRWAMTLLERTAAALREEALVAGKEPLFTALAPFLSSEPDPGNYARIAGTFGMSRSAVAMAVHRLRLRFRDLLRREVAETLSDASELESEMEALRAALRR